MVKRVGTLFFLIYQALSGHTQSFTTINYSVPEGLPSVEVYEVFQDRKGFLWFATDNGVVKFDGYEMQTFQTEQGLSDPVVFGFHEDSKGRIWFRTYSGKLSYYDHREGKIFKYKYNEKLAKICENSFPLVIHVDSLEQLWYSVSDEWGKIDSAGNIQKHQISKKCGSYYIDIGNKYLYGRSRNAISPAINIDGNLFGYEVSPNGSGLTALSGIVWKKKLYLSLGDALFEYDKRTLKKVINGKGTLISLSVDGEDNLWVGYMKGVVRYGNTDFSDPWAPAFFKDVAVTEVIQDHEKGFWFSTLEKGAFYIPNFNIKNQLLSSDRNVIGASLLDNNIIVSLRQGDLLAIDKNTHVVKRKKIFKPNVYSHFVDSKKNIWLPNQTNTVIVDSSFREKGGVPGMCPLWEDDEKVIWGKEWNSVNIRTYNLNRELLNNEKLNFFVRNILVHDSLVFVTGRTGIRVYNKKLNLVKDLNALADYKISKTLSLNESTLLLTTIGDGFFLLNKKNWQHSQYNKKRSFIANHIYTVLKTDSSLWLASEYGIIKTSISSLLNKTPSFQVMTQKSGLISDKVNFLLEVDDHIWSFSDHGYSVFPKNTSHFSNDLPVFYIQEFSINDQKTDPKNGVKLPYESNNFSLRFGFIAFNNQNVFSRYRIKKEASWNYTTERNLKFNSLSPGEYDLEIEYSIDNVRWIRGFSLSDLTVAPPLWQTWYFQTMIALVVLLVIVLYFVNQVRIYKIHQRKLIQAELEAIEEERGRIARDLHDSVGTDFSAIKMVVTQLLTKYSEPKTGEVETQFQSTIQEIKNIIYGLSPPGLERYGLFSALTNYIDKLNNTISIKIEINTFGIEVRDPKLSMTVFRIIQELISNSLKHSNAETIALHLNSFEDLLNIVYEDNGKGFVWTEKHSGLGLFNIESRIQSMNGKLKFESGPFGISYTIDIPIKENSTA